VNRRVPSLLQSVLAATFIVTIGVSQTFAASERILYNFHPLGRGSKPIAGLVSDAAGNLYGSTPWGGSEGVGTIFELTPKLHGGWIQTVIYSFKAGAGVSVPSSELIFDALGNLYGSGGSGGDFRLGGVFKLTRNAKGLWTESVLSSFNGYVGTGALTLDPAGNLYGVLRLGVRGQGSVFELLPQSNGAWTKRTLYVFNGGVHGGQPNGSLVMDQSGNLYGTTTSGGPAGGGVVFELAPSSSGPWNETVLHGFAGGSDGFGPASGLTMDLAGNLYGTTVSGGLGCGGIGCGTVFKMTPGSSGQWTKSILYDLNGGNDGASPYSPLAIDHAGNLYGMTLYGGSGGMGTVFELLPGSNGQWSESVVWTFVGGADGQNPQARVLVGGAGQLFGTTSSGGTYANGSVFELLPGTDQHWTKEVLTDFPFTDGGYPEATLIFDSAGNLYGTTTENGGHGFGSVFKLSPSGETWKETTLYNFTAGPRFHREPSASSLIFDASGNLYGETTYGGVRPSGTVFELSPLADGSWTEKDIYTFNGYKDGGNPLGGLILDQAGNLYGTTVHGGMTGCDSGCGTVFKLTPGSDGHWTETVLYKFAGGDDGAGPAAGLVFDQAGNLYGTTQQGGAHTPACSVAGCGTVFKLSPGAGGAWNESLLHVFTEIKGDGAWPQAGLNFDASGNLYGTTRYGGTHSLDCSLGCGVVFELTPTTGSGWTATTLDTFVGADGSYPVASVILDAAGNLYGTTQGGGFGTQGTVFELVLVSGIWNDNILHLFEYSTAHDGQLPMGGLIFDQAGNLYGTTSGGGAGAGTVFEITP
jgi:uncharacterized repeat protein (TIGR03803 family)